MEVIYYIRQIASKISKDEFLSLCELLYNMAKAMGPPEKTDE